MQSKNEIIFAVAGAGKTYDICNQALSELPINKKILIVTYTHKGIESIKKELKKQNFGIINFNIKIKTWHSFLLSELIKPYQKYITNRINKIKSIDFSNMYGEKAINYNKRGTKMHYLSSEKYINCNYASEFIVDCNTLSGGKVIARLEEIYSHIFFDEVQDMAGEDFKIFDLLVDSNINTYYVGDHRQATFSTHNAKKNKSISGINVIKYFQNLEGQKKAIIKYNSTSRRFNKSICDFANLIFDDDFEIQTCMTETTAHDGVYLIKEEDANIYCKEYKPVILKYDIKTKIECESLNFGQCKGMTFDRVLIYPNGPYLKFLKGNKLESPSKYYVAATRPKYSLTFVVEELFENEKFKLEEMIIDDKKIKVSKFIP